MTEDLKILLTNIDNRKKKKEINNESDIIDMNHDILKPPFHVFLGVGENKNETKKKKSMRTLIGITNSEINSFDKLCNERYKTQSWKSIIVICNIYDINVAKSVYEVWYNGTRTVAKRFAIGLYLYQYISKELKDTNVFYITSKL